jgi:hypothetical protein
MTTLRGPLATLAAVAVAGAGLWLVNSAADPDRGPQLVSVPAAATATVTSTAVPVPSPQFPSAAEYSGSIPTAGAPIVVELSVTGGTARAYVCDGDAIETWLSGNVAGDSVHLVSDGGALDGRLQGRAVIGRLSLGEKSWDFTAPEVTDVR